MADMLMASVLSNLIVDLIINGLQSSDEYYCLDGVHMMYTRGLLNTALERFVLKSCVTGYHKHKDIYGLPGLEHHAAALYATLQTFKVCADESWPKVEDMTRRCEFHDHPDGQRCTETSEGKAK